ncbi:hypothetical protein FACS1894110_11750 [Spirochaetia bacterium]|nr:hypothetical protein FACS1894110_11750 [Spirochaetia bacterium]
MTLNDFSGTPVYAYRGVMLDVARHFFPAAEIFRLLDVMGRLHLNKFHWHFADDQGFRIDLPQFPRLKAIASKRAYTGIGGHAGSIGNDGIPHSGCYSEEDVRAVIAYAAERGIEVIPELDMPGHLSALIAAYPELSCSGEAITVPGEFGILHNTLCIGNDDALHFMEKILHALCDLFTPKTFHLGFDEVKLDHLKTCPKCRAKMAALNYSEIAGLKTHAKNFFRDSLKQRGIDVIIYNDGMDAVDPEVICYYWKGRDGCAETTVKWLNAGQRVIMAPQSHVYMDYPYIWTPLKKTYAFNPVMRGVTKPENIIGVEAPLWTEYVATHEKLAFNVYYRLYALARIGWDGSIHEPYRDFIRALHKHEADYFGETLAISEHVLNPNFFTRHALSRTCMYTDMDAEFKHYRKR